MKYFTFIQTPESKLLNNKTSAMMIMMLDLLGFIRGSMWVLLRVFATHMGLYIGVGVASNNFLHFEE